MHRVLLKAAINWLIHVLVSCLLLLSRDAAANNSPVDNRIRPPHNPTFTSNVQGLLRTKVEGGMLYFKIRFTFQLVYVAICMKAADFDTCV